VPVSDCGQACAAFADFAARQIQASASSATFVAAAADATAYAPNTPTATAFPADPSTCSATSASKPTTTTPFGPTTAIAIDTNVAKFCRPSA